MAQQFKTSKYPGVEYREHKSRRHGARPDRYYTVRYYRRGKQVREAFGWASEGWTIAKVYDILCTVKSNIKLGSGPQSLKDMRELKAQEEARKEAEAAKQKTFAEAGDLFIVEYSRPNKRSSGHDEARLRDHLKPILGDLVMQEITSFDVERMKQAAMNKGLSPSTVKQCLALTRQIFNYSTKRGWFIGENPCKGVKWPKINNQRVRYLSEQEEADFFDHAKEYNRFIHDVCLISLYAGLRMGEIFALQAMDIDMQKDRILVRGLDPEAGPKGGYNRTLPMHSKIKDALRPILMGLAPDDLVFPKPDGTQRVEIGQPFYTIMSHLGWNDRITDRRLKIVPHTFRHTFASRLVEKGARLPVIQQLMGHSTIQMTMRYVHVDDDQCKSAIDIL